jgi:AAA family ATP:ADP antiporter
VFALFVPSVFWSLMADIFRPDQAKRLFGFLIAGTSTGGIVGPFISATLVRTVGTINLLLIAIVFLVASIFCIRYLTRWHARAHNPATATRGGDTQQQDVNRPLGGSLWAGFSLVARSPYLQGIAIFMVLLGWASTFLYLQQADLVEKALPDREARTQLFGWVDFSVQAMSLLLQLLLFSRLTKWLRPPALLMCVPLLMAFAYIVFAFSPVLTTVLGAMILRRVGEYGIVRPAREMLYTTVDRETKYKAKNFLDTAFYRIGDATSASVHSGLLALGFSTSGIGWAGAVVSGVWAAVAYRLGRAHDAAIEQPPGGQESPVARPATTSART